MTIESLTLPSEVVAQQNIHIQNTENVVVQKRYAPFQLPNGATIMLRNSPKGIIGQRDFLTRLIESGQDGISSHNIYGGASDKDTRNLEARVKHLRKSLRPAGYVVSGKTNSERGKVFTLEEEDKTELMLPNGKAVTLSAAHSGTTSQYDVLKLLIERGLRGIKVTDFYNGDTDKTRGNLKAVLSRLRQQIAPEGYLIVGRIEVGELTKFTLEEMVHREVTLPNGKKINVSGARRRDTLKLLCERGEDGVTLLDIYGEGNVNEKRLGNLLGKVKGEIEDLGYQIKGVRNKDGSLRYVLDEKKNITLPNGTIIEGLHPKQESILQFFIETNLPVFRNTLIEKFFGGESSLRTRSNVESAISRINIALGNNGRLVLATKKRVGSSNSAYYLELTNLNEKKENSFAKKGDLYINQRVEKIKSLFMAQESNQFTLTNKINERLSNELQQLQEEATIRRRIEERKRAKIEEWNRKQNGPKEDDFVDEPENEYDPIVRFTRIRYLFSNKGLPNEILDKVGQEAFEKAKENFSPKNGFSLEEYAEFWIRGAMGNMLLYGSPEAPETESHGLAVPDESITSFKKDFTIALVDLSSRRRYPENFITPYESRALDIMRGITGKNPGSSEDVAYEFDSSIQWAERLARTGMEKLMNSPHAPTLAKYFSA